MKHTCFCVSKVVKFERRSKRKEITKRNRYCYVGFDGGDLLRRKKRRGSTCNPHGNTTIPCFPHPPRVCGSSYYCFLLFKLGTLLD